MLVAAVPGTASAATQQPAWRTSLFDEPIDPERGYVVSDRTEALAADGTAVVAWVAHRADTFRNPRASRALRMAVTTGARALGPPRTLSRRSVAPIGAAASAGGAALVVWSSARRLHAALRTRTGAPLRIRAIARDTGSAINQLRAVADPRGGWLVVERQYPAGRCCLPYSIRVLRLSPGGAVHDDRVLGAGSFGLYAASQAPAAFAADGRAWIAADGPGGPGPGGGDRLVSIWSSPRDGSFGERQVPDDPAFAQPGVVAGPGEQVAVTWTSAASRGDGGIFGAPRIALGGADGRLGPSTGPRVRFPRRTFGADGAALAPGAWLLAWQEKSRIAPFSREGAIRAAVLRSGRLGPARTLVADQRASGATVTSLGAGRALLRYAVDDRVHLATVSADGAPRRIGSPPWPRQRFTASTTAAGAGHWVLVTRVDGRGVRAALARL